MTTDGNVCMWYGRTSHPRECLVLIAVVHYHYHLTYHALTHDGPVSVSLLSLSLSLLYWKEIIDDQTWWEASSLPITPYLSRGTVNFSDTSPFPVWLIVLC